jgi:hypothetical protein
LPLTTADAAASTPGLVGMFAPLVQVLVAMS